MQPVTTIEINNLQTMLDSRSGDTTNHFVQSSPRRSPCLIISTPFTDNLPAVIAPDHPSHQTVSDFYLRRQAALDNGHKERRMHRAVSPYVTAVSTKTIPQVCLKALAPPPRLVRASDVPAFVRIRPPQTKVTSFRGLAALRKAAECIELQHKE